MGGRAVAWGSVAGSESLAQPLERAPHLLVPAGRFPEGSGTAPHQYERPQLTHVSRLLVPGRFSLFDFCFAAINSFFDLPAFF